MRIALLSLHFAEYACRLAAALAEHHDVHLFLSEGNVNDELEDELAQYRGLPRLTISTVKHGKSPWLMLQNMLGLLRAVRAFRPDVVHLQEDSKDYLFAAVCWLRRRYPLVLTVHDPQPHSGEDAKEINNSRHGLYRKVLRRLSDQALTHGERLREELERVAPSLAGRVTSVPVGPYGPMQFPADAPRQGSLLFFGRINAYKGLRYFLDAILLLRERGVDVQGVIAGRGNDLEPNRATIAAHPCFTLHEEFISRAKLHQLFRQTQLIVMPYTDGTQSGVAAMALGFGRPVVATRVGSIPEMVLDGRNGLIVPPCDAASLADAIASLVGDPVRYAHMSGEVRSLACGQFSWSEAAAVTSAVYARAVAARAA